MTLKTPPDGIEFGSKLNTITTPTHNAVAALVSAGLIADGLLTRDDAYAVLADFYAPPDAYCRAQPDHEARTDVEPPPPEPHCGTPAAHRMKRRLERGHGPGVRALITKAVDDVLDGEGID